MKTVHHTIIVGKCPHGCADVYFAEFHVEDRVLRVEDIQAAIDILTVEPVYQESLTQRLADALGCRVITHGTHKAFDTHCCADPKGKNTQ